MRRAHDCEFAAVVADVLSVDSEGSVRSMHDINLLDDCSLVREGFGDSLFMEVGEEAIALGPGQIE